MPYADKSFDVVIVSNALHIVPQPEKALQEIKRALKDDGVLIAPTFTHAENSIFGKVRAFFMKLAGFPLHSRWTSEEYLRFLRQNGWTVRIIHTPRFRRRKKSGMRRKTFIRRKCKLKLIFPFQRIRNK